MRVGAAALPGRRGAGDVFNRSRLVLTPARAERFAKDGGGSCRVRAHVKRDNIYFNEGFLLRPKPHLTHVSPSRHLGKYISYNFFHRPCIFFLTRDLPPFPGEGCDLELRLTQ
jgi:hypothetical protein